MIKQAPGFHWPNLCLLVLLPTAKNNVLYSIFKKLFTSIISVNSHNSVTWIISSSFSWSENGAMERVSNPASVSRVLEAFLWRNMSCQMRVLPSPHHKPQCMAQRPPWEGKALAKEGASLQAGGTAWDNPCSPMGGYRDQALGAQGCVHRILLLWAPAPPFVNLGISYLAREMLRNAQKWQPVKCLAQS